MPAATIMIAAESTPAVPTHDGSAGVPYPSGTPAAATRAIPSDEDTPAARAGSRRWNHGSAMPAASTVRQ